MSEREPWGHKLTVSIYFEGPPDEDQITYLTEAINDAVPEANFVGMALADVEDEPKDQIGT